MNDAKIQGIVSNQSAFEKLLFLCDKNTGPHMSVWVTTVTGTVLAAMEFRNFLFARYNVNPPNLENKCNGYLQTFSVRHMLS